MLKLAETHSLEWPIPETLSNKDIEYLFYPNRGNNEGRRLPDYEYVYNELAKPGVTLSLLWAEYCAKCEAEHTIPYQHSQFNDKYHAYAASKKAMQLISLFYQIYFLALIYGSSILDHYCSSNI